MKKLTLPAGCVLGLLSFAVFAGDTTDYSKPGMQQFAQQMNAMQTCMATIDELDYSRFETLVNTFNTILPDLCQAKNYPLIQAKMDDLSQQINTSQAFQKIQECSAPLRSSGFIPNMPIIPNASSAEFEALCQNVSK